MGENTAGIESRAVRAIPEVPKEMLAGDEVKNRYHTFDEYLRDADRAHFTGDPQDFGAEGAIQYITQLEVSGVSSEASLRRNLWRSVFVVVVVYAVVMVYLDRRDRQR